MRTSKKLLSFFLAVVMVVTTCSVGFTAFAKDEQSIWSTSCEAQDAFNTLDDLANSYLPSVLMGVESISTPVYEKYAKDYGKTSAKDLTDKEKEEIKTTKATFKDILGVLQPVLLNALAGTTQQDFVDMYYRGANVNDFNYLNQRDDAMSYYTLVNLCKKYRNDFTGNPLSAEERQQLSDWYDALWPLSQLATAAEEKIKVYIDKFNKDNMDNQLGSAGLFALENYDYGMPAEDVAFFEGLYPSYTDKLVNDYGVTEGDIVIDSFGKLLYYFYGVGKIYQSAYPYYNLIKSAGVDVTFVGEGDLMGMGAPIQYNITDDITPINADKIIADITVIGLGEMMGMDFATDGKADYTKFVAGMTGTTPDEATVAYFQSMMYGLGLDFYMNTVLPSHYNAAIAGIAGISLDELTSKVAGSLPGKALGADSSVLSEDDYTVMALALETLMNADQNVNNANAKVFFSGEPYTIKFVDGNSTKTFEVTLPEALKGTSTAKYLELITGSSQQPEYKANLVRAFFPTYFTNGANRYQKNPDGTIKTDDQGRPIIAKPSYSTDVINEYFAAAENYTYSQIVTKMSGVKGSLYDPARITNLDPKNSTKLQSLQKFVIDINAYIESQRDDTAGSSSVKLTEEQLAILNGDYNFANEMGQKLLNYTLNDSVVSILENEMIGNVLGGLLESNVDLVVAFKDLWNRLLESPVATIVEILPVLVVIVDELIIPIAFNGDGDAFNGLIMDVLGGTLLAEITQNAGSYIGLGQVGWDLNELLPMLMHWLMEGNNAAGITYYDLGTKPVMVKDADGNLVDKKVSALDMTASDAQLSMHYTIADANSNKLTYAYDETAKTETYSYMGETVVVKEGDNAQKALDSLLDKYVDSVFSFTMEYESNVPVLTNVYTVDWALRDAKISDLSALLTKATGDETLGKGLAEVITELAVLFTASVDEFVATPALRNATRYSHEGKISATGLNNLFVAIPQLFDIMENLAAEKYGVDKNAWTYCFDGKITTEVRDTADGNNTYTQTINSSLEELKKFAGSNAADRSIGILDCFVGIFVEEWLDAILNLVNNVVSESELVNTNLPIVTGLLNALGGLGKESILTDILNGVFQQKRGDKYSFEFEKQASGFIGLDRDNAYFLITNVETLIDVITSLVNSINAGNNSNNNNNNNNTSTAPTAPQTPKAAKTTPYSANYTDKEINNVNSVIDSLDEMLSSLLSDSSINGYGINTTSNIFAGVISLLSNYISEADAKSLMGLVDSYLFYLNGADARTADANGNIKPNEVYTNANLTDLIVRTYALIENISASLLAKYDYTGKLDANQVPINYNLISRAISGVISPDAVSLKLGDPAYKDAQSKITKLTSWNDAIGANGAVSISIDWNVKAGDENAFFNGLATGLRLITSILGVVLVDANLYANVVYPVLTALCSKVGVKVDTPEQFADSTNPYRDEVLLGLIRPIMGWLDKFLAQPVTTLIYSVQGIAAILDDNNTSAGTIASIVSGAVTPIKNEISGISNILKAKSSKLGPISITLAGAVDKFIADTFTKLTKVENNVLVDLLVNNVPLSGSNIIPIVNTLLVKFGITLNNIDWAAISGASSKAHVFFYIIEYLVDTVLSNDNLDAIVGLIVGDKGVSDTIKSIIDAIKNGKLDGNTIVKLLAKVLNMTKDPTMFAWTFEHYLLQVVENFNYPIGISKSDADRGTQKLDAAISNIFPLLQSFGVDLGGDNLSEILSSNLFKNDTLTALATGLYGALDTKEAAPYLNLLGIDVSTAGVAEILTDKSYGKTYSSAAKAIKKASSWKKVKKVNWGFTDGAKNAQQGFVNALVAILRPVNDVLAVFLNEKSLNVDTEALVKLITTAAKGESYLKITDTNYAHLTFASNGSQFIIKVVAVATADGGKTFTAIAGSKESEIILDLNAISKLNIYGTNGYNSAIIPLLEAFQCKGIVSYAKYQANAAAAKDNLLLDILNPIVGSAKTSLLNKITAKPVETLTALLPNIAVFIDAHGVSQLLANLLAPVTAIIEDVAVNFLDFDKKMATQLGDYVASLIGMKKGTLKINLANLASINIEDAIIPAINFILKSQKINIKLPNIDWNALISLGEKTTYKSIATDVNGKALTGKKLVNVDNGKVLITVLRYVSKTLINNAKALSKLLCGIKDIKKNETISSIIKSVFHTIGESSEDDIVRAIFYFLNEDPTNAFWDYTAYETGEYDFSYPESVDVDFLKSLPPMLDGLVGSLADINGLIGDALFKDELIGKLAVGLYGAIEGVKINDKTNLAQLLALTDIDVTTDNVAKLLVDEDYGMSFEGPASVIASAGSWSKVNADSLKWGVKDRDSFFHALVAVLRPLYGVLDVLLNDASLGLFDIVRLPGSNGYTSSIVPLMEAFSMYNIKTQYQYRQDILEEYDNILLDIINPLWDKVEDILAAPLQTLTAMLPNLALFIGNDGLCQIIDNLFTPVSALADAIKPVANINEILTAVLDSLNVDLNSTLAKIGVTNFNLDLYDLKETLKPLLGGDAIVPLLNNVLGLIKIGGKPLGLKLNDIDWLQLASHGETKVDASQAATFGARIYVVGNSSETLIAVLRYLIDTVNTGNNFEMVTGLVTGLLGDSVDDSMADTIGQVLGMLQGDTDEVIASLVDLLQTLA